MTQERIVIGIAGRSGSGKSTLARKISEHFADDAVILSLDNYYKNQDDVPLHERTVVNYDHPDSLEFSLLVQHITQLLTGEPVTIPTYDFENHTRSSVEEKINPVPIIVIEGILALVNKDLRDLFSITLFVDTSADVCFNRRLQRDIAERGRDENSVRSQYIKTVEPMQKEFVDPSKQYAKYVVSGEADLSIVTAEVITKIGKYSSL